jgi:hypothetical protein
LKGLGEVLGAVDAPKIRNAKKGCNTMTPKQCFWSPVGVRSVQEARRSIKMKEKEKRQKSEKRLHENEASTGPSVVECKHPGGGTPKLVGVKRGEKRTCFGPAEVVFTVGVKARFRDDVGPLAVGSL